MSHSVLQLIPFPTGNARHGGQIRARETNLALQKFGFDVTKIEVFDAGGYAPEKPDIDISDTLANGRWLLNWELRDYSIGAALAEDGKAFSKLVSLLPSRIDLVVVEEPWLGAAAIRLRREGHLDAPIMFNSYNVEHIAKRFILEEAEFEEASKYAEKIAEIEQAIVKEADRCSVVTAEDASVYGEWSSSDIVVAPNGTARRKRSHLGGVLHHGVEAHARYALFVGSAHPPNVAGFRDLVMESIPCLRSHERFVVAGSVGEPLYRHVTESNFPYLFRDKLCLVGRVTDFGLDCLIANASVILLPITYGEGSNLKTAEALMSGKPIVATQKAFRGYEEFLGATGVRIANNQLDFAAAIRESFDVGQGKHISRPGTETLLWENTLSPIVDAAAELVAAPRRKRAVNLGYEPARN